MRDLSNIEDVAAFEPDFMGFIWASKSPRYVGEDFKIPVCNIFEGATKANSVVSDETKLSNEVDAIPNNIPGLVQN